MKRSILTLFFFVIISTTFCFSQRDSGLMNMHHIPKGELVVDSIGKIIFKAFWISNQITNKEFREFWDYAKSYPQEDLYWADITPPLDKKSNSQPTIKKIKYSELVKESLDNVNWPSENYFESVEFDDSPVLGVSEDLATYYCIWKTSITYTNLNENERNPSYSYYLPTTLHMMYARKANSTIFSNNENGFRIVIFTE